MRSNVRFALYNLYSFIRPETRQSIAPMGLSSQGYNGHIFGILNFGCTRLLALQPDMAKSSSITVLIVCKEAKATVYGYKGAMFGNLMT
jgi:trehalose/maltose hydrolase-like predicted phosphorylase